MMQYAAFFDVDETVLRIKSMASFLKFYLTAKRYTEKQISSMVNSLVELSKQGRRREANTKYFKVLEGEQYAKLEEFGIEWFESLDIENLLNQSVVCEIQKHKENGSRVVFVSGAFHAILLPLAKRLMVDDVICTTLEVRNGLLTGNVLTQMLEETKAEAIMQHASLNHIDLKHSYAYSDDISDLPMMECVSNIIWV